MSKPEISRRQLLATAPLAVAIPAIVTAGEPQKKASPQTAPPAPAKVDYTFNVESKSVAPLGNPSNATLVNGVLPGPEIRYREGDRFSVLVNNRLQVPITVHWHGMIVPNYMDGVPDITQAPIAPNGSVVYEYPLRQTGTYWYHSHYQFQEQTGLSGPLIVEARDEPHSYDHDVVVFLQDWLDQVPEGIIPQIRGEQKATQTIQAPKPGGYTLPKERPFGVDINYPGYLINGRSPTEPWTLKVRKGDRIRFRFINGSTASFFRVALDGHSMQLIAADGQPIEPFEVSNFVIATAERYDALVTVGKSGSFTLHAAALGTHRQGIGVVHTADAVPKADTSRPTFAGRSGGMPDYAELKSPYSTKLPDGPVQTFNIDLGGSMKKYLWSMAGEYYPEPYVPEGNAGPLIVQYGQRVRVRFTNSTMMYHPMHLHGHFFRLLPKPGAWDSTDAPMKDTVGVGPGQKIDIEFFADNPGNWFFHCHNLYHLASGMARVVRYEV
ncbi:MAG: multicopper oxidase family protein [Planctomycetales bacterium]